METLIFEVYFFFNLYSCFSLTFSLIFDSDERSGEDCIHSSVTDGIKERMQAKKL